MRTEFVEIATVLNELHPGDSSRNSAAGDVRSLGHLREMPPISAAPRS